MTCAICMEDIDDTISETNRAILSCNHEFHPKCILEWFKKSDTCPTCRESHTKRETIEDEDISRESIISLMNTIGEQVHTTQMNLNDITAHSWGPVSSLRTGRLISRRIHLSDITNTNSDNSNPNSIISNIFNSSITDTSGEDSNPNEFFARRDFLRAETRRDARAVNTDNSNTRSNLLRSHRRLHDYATPEWARDFSD